MKDDFTLAFVRKWVQVFPGENSIEKLDSHLSWLCISVYNGSRRETKVEEYAYPSEFSDLLYITGLVGETLACFEKEYPSAAFTKESLPTFSYNLALIAARAARCVIRQALDFKDFYFWDYPNLCGYISLVHDTLKACDESGKNLLATILEKDFEDAVDDYLIGLIDLARYEKDFMSRQRPEELPEEPPLKWYHLGFWACPEEEPKKIKQESVFDKPVDIARISSVGLAKILNSINSRFYGYEKKMSEKGQAILKKGLHTFEVGAFKLPTGELPPTLAEYTAKKAKQVARASKVPLP